MKIERINMGKLIVVVFIGPFRQLLGESAATREEYAPL